MMALCQTLSLHTDIKQRLLTWRHLGSEFDGCILREMRHLNWDNNLDWRDEQFYLVMLEYLTTGVEVATELLKRQPKSIWSCKTHHAKIRGLEER